MSPLPVSTQSYRDRSYHELENDLDARSSGGASLDELSAIIEKAYIKRNRSIRDVAFHRLDPASVEDDYLYPRKDLNRFAVENWIRRIFLGGLKPRIVDKIYPLGLFVAPPEWFFSMKYFVNRAYDYVCAMRNHGHSLETIGFDAPRKQDGIDPDYRYLRNAHKLMLHLQGLIQNRIGAYGLMVDYSWMSGTRFGRLVEIGGDSFRNDFDTMVLEGGLLKPSEAAQYRMLHDRITAHATDRLMEGRAQDLVLFPKDFRYETIYKDSDRYRIRVPYAWADLGFFAFSAIASHIARIVESRLLHALPSMGMPASDFAKYSQTIGSN